MAQVSQTMGNFYIYVQTQLKLPINILVMMYLETSSTLVIFWDVSNFVPY